MEFYTLEKFKKTSLQYGLMSRLSEKFEESKVLEEFAEEILSEVKELEDATFFKWKIMFAKRKFAMHFGGVCRRLGDPIRFKTGLDYLILISKDEFELISPDQKVALVIHELNHIETKGKDRFGEWRPTIRRHHGNYCEIPQHDSFSRGLAEPIVKKLKTLKKLTTQTILAE